MTAEKLHAATPPDTNNQGDEEKDEKAFGNIFPELESVDLPLGTSLRYTSICLTVKIRVILTLYCSIVV